MIKIAGRISGLSWRSGRSLPGNVGEIKELSHIDLTGVSLGETGKLEAGLHELQPSRRVGHGMGNVILPGKG
jgi:hypothetical protein